MDYPYLMVISYPHQWRDDSTVRFATEEQRQAYFDDFKSERDLGRPGEEKYVSVRFATVTETLN